MKKHTKTLAAILTTFILMGSFSSCVDPYGKNSSSYYKKERAKYEVMDMHSDCPQLIKK